MLLACLFQEINVTYLVIKKLYGASYNTNDAAIYTIVGWYLRFGSVQSTGTLFNA